MRNFFVYLVASWLLGSASSSALAVNLIYEPFDYTSGQALGPPNSSVSWGLRNTQAGTTAGTADNSVNTAKPSTAMEVLETNGCVQRRLRHLRIRSISPAAA